MFYHSLSYIQEKITLSHELRPLACRTGGSLWGVEQNGKIIAVTFVYGRKREYCNISKNTKHGDTEVYLYYGFFFFLYISKEQHSCVYCTFRNQLRNGVGDPAIDCEFSV